MKEVKLEESAYQFDAKMSLKQAIPLGLQHVMALYAGAVAVPLIVGGALGYSAADLASLVGNVVLHVRGGADLDFDALPDEHRETLRALLAPVPAAPAVPENVLLGDWIAVALDGAVAEVRDFRPGAVTTDTTAANGAKPSPAQAEKANALIREWLDEYAAGGDAVSAQTFEDHCVLKIGALSA